MKLEEISRRTVEAADKMGLQINQKKSTLIKIEANKNDDESLILLRRGKSGIRRNGGIYVFEDSVNQ